MRWLPKYVAVVLSIALLLGSLAGCSSGSAVYLDYQTGLDEFGRWDDDYFEKNGNSDATSPDPGVFYVSEEEDPVWGGYFYRYQTGDFGYLPIDDFNMLNNVSKVAFYCDRSTDLFAWEPAGALPMNYSLAIRNTDWCSSLFWAPEVIRNPADGKYYMYFSAERPQDDFSTSGLNNDRKYIGVAVSDTPVGPFMVINDYDEELNMNIPTINFQAGLNLDHNLGAIDANAFFDINGDLYLYFVHHFDSNNGNNYICGMKMESMAYPDYSTAVALLAPNRATLSSLPGGDLSYVAVEDYWFSEGSVNEGPFMYYHNGLYYLTYSANGYSNIAYSVHQAVGESPLGPFRKLSKEEGNPVHDGSQFGDVYGAAHHSLVEVGEELWIVYHRHSGIYGMGWERPAATDRVNFVRNSDGLDVMTSNGPSMTLMWKSEELGGHQNLAAQAQISANRGTGVQYLADEVLPIYELTSSRKYSVEDGQVIITLKWDKPVEVSSLMVYNSATSERAFSQIAEVRFALAEKPEWASEDYSYAVIQNLPIEADAWDPVADEYLECAPAVAVFDPIKVNSITITINESDRLEEYSKLGELITAVDVSEIIVLGGKGQ